MSRLLWPAVIGTAIAFMVALATEDAQSAGLHSARPIPALLVVKGSKKQERKWCMRRDGVRYLAQSGHCPNADR